MTVNVFSVPVFLIVFRETLETVIIISVLLAFLKQTLDGPGRDEKVYKKLVRQVWLGTGIGLFICLVIAGALIGVFYTLGSNKWDSSENAYEGAFALIASIIITIVGAALLRIGKMQEKWRLKLAAAMEGPVKTNSTRTGRLKHYAEKYAMFVLPFITVLREGIEAIVFVAGVSFSATAKSVPLPVVIGLLAGGVVGYALYKGGSTTKMQIFLVFSTCLLYLVAAGLFSRAVWGFEMHYWNKALGGGEAAELGNGPGSYDIDQSVWHVNCCSPEFNGGGGWGFFNAILGWTNSATYGSVISYNLYWLVVILAFLTMRYREVKGHWPLLKSKVARQESEPNSDERGSEVNSETRSKIAATEKAKEVKA
ncbi:putative iron transferase [Phialemonium atrogriseum]|uniref:Iron transferase n=1 Tax=Phialemonium atrogriseum TaxID=1093897 RepID=A0AAJ0C0N3_9PEZI|nr:putative iron transferase [Phialemonium atrogriseum]KAK1765516.1 putative iron transferase [Phialemonium atrogriseum]